MKRQGGKHSFLKRKPSFLCSNTIANEVRNECTVRVGTGQNIRLSATSSRCLRLYKQGKNQTIPLIFLYVNDNIHINIHSGAKGFSILLFYPNCFYNLSGSRGNLAVSYYVSTKQCLFLLFHVKCCFESGCSLSPLHECLWSPHIHKGYHIVSYSASAGIVFYSNTCWSTQPRLLTCLSYLWHILAKPRVVTRGLCTLIIIISMSLLYRYSKLYRLVTRLTKRKYHERPYRW